MTYILRFILWFLLFVYMDRGLGVSFSLPGDLLSVIGFAIVITIFSLTNQFLDKKEQ